MLSPGALLTVYAQIRAGVLVPAFLPWMRW